MLWVLIRSASASGEINKISNFWIEKSALTRAVIKHIVLALIRIFSPVMIPLSSCKACCKTNRNYLPKGNGYTFMGR